MSARFAVAISLSMILLAIFSDASGATRRFLLAAVTALVVSAGAVGCGGGGEESGQLDPDTLSRRQRDSILSTLPVPGAGAVGKALDAADAARARAERHDSILEQHFLGEGARDRVFDLDAARRDER